MRVEDAVGNTAIFIGVEANGRYVPTGTATIAGKYREMWFQYIATARHLLDSIQSDRVSIRYNSRVGGCEVISVPKSYIHPLGMAEDISICSFRSDWIFMMLQ